MTLFYFHQETSQCFCVYFFYAFKHHFVSLAVQLELFLLNPLFPSNHKTNSIGCWLYYALQVFHSTINRWSFTGVWVTVKFLSSSGFFDVFCQMVLILPLMSNSSSPLFEPLGTVPSSPTTIGITVTLMFYSFFSSQARSKYSSIVSLSIFILWSARAAKSLLTLGFLAEIKWSICIKNDVKNFMWLFL